MNFYELYRIIKEYGEKTIDFLVQKFKKEEPALSDQIIRRYIERFELIKNNLPNKDIVSYSWKELENTVDGYQSKQKIKAGKLDPTVSDANLLYNQNKIRIYLGKDKKSCVKYGNGYTFCISARGEENMYAYYRFEQNGTPYFIFNDNLPTSDNRHLIVLFVYKKRNQETKYYYNSYSVTLADNLGEKEYKELSTIIGVYPWISPISNFISEYQYEDEEEENEDEDTKDKYIDKGYVEPEPLEKLEYILEKEYSMKRRYKKQDVLKGKTSNADWHVSRLLDNISSEKIKDFSNNQGVAISVTLHLGSGWASLKADYIPDYMQRNAMSLDSKWLSTKEKSGDYFDVSISKIDSFVLKNENEIITRTKELVKNYLKDVENTEEGSKTLIKKTEDYIEKNKINIIKSFKKGIEGIEDEVLTSGFPEYFWIGKERAHLLTKIEIEDKPLFYVYVSDISENFKRLLDEKSKDIENYIDLQNKYNRNLDYLRNSNEENLKKILDTYNLSMRRDLFGNIDYYIKNPRRLSK